MVLDDGIIFMTLMIWYIPGWLRTTEPQKGVVESLTSEKEMRAAFRKTENQLDRVP